MTSGVPSSEDQPPGADRRAFPRVTVALPAFLDEGSNRHPVQIADLSVGGAKLDCAARLLAGTRVVLCCGTLLREAVVRWTAACTVGICFDSELDSREASALVERSKSLEAWRKAHK